MEEIIKRSRIVAPEKDTQKAIIEYLQLRGLMCWRNNTGATPFPKKGGGNYYVKYGLTGSGDILGITKNGTFFSIEVKARGRKPNPNQVQFMEAVNDNKGIAFVAYDVDDVAGKL